MEDSNIPQPTPQEIDRQLRDAARVALRRRLAHLSTVDEDRYADAISAQLNRTARALAILDGAA